MPWDVAVDEQNSYIAVTDCNNHRIQVFDMDGTFMFKFGSEGSEKGQFKNPKGIAYAPNGHMIVADFNNHRIQVFNEDGRFIRMFGNFGTGRPGSLNHPCGVGVFLRGLGTGVRARQPQSAVVWYERGVRASVWVAGPFPRDSLFIHITCAWINEGGSSWQTVWMIAFRCLTSKEIFSLILARKVSHSVCMLDKLFCLP